jgi:uncharacterized protein (TIGR02246 family)
MTSLTRALAIAGLVVVAACRPSRFDPNDPAVMAAIDSLVAEVSAGAAAVDADRVLSAAADDISFVTGEVLLSGRETLLARFRETYSGLARQDQRVIEKQVRILGPDLVVVIVIAEGTYTDKAGWTSPAVGIGTTIVFVRENGQWRAKHAHQSIAY